MLIAIGKRSYEHLLVELLHAAVNLCYTIVYRIMLAQSTFLAQLLKLFYLIFKSFEMKKVLLFIGISSLLIGCGGVKRTQEALNAGDYSNAINGSIRRLTENKTKKGNQQYILLLEEAYKKNTERELQHITFLEKDGNESNYDVIFKAYNDLRSIQERIKPLLPLKLMEENRDARFEFNNYQNEIIDYKESLSEYLFDNAETLLANAVTKQDYRKAYEDFQYLEEINPDFEDTREKMQAALEKGTEYVSVAVVNNSQRIIPARLSEHLLNFNTYGLDEQWVKYHTNHIINMRYDYDMQIMLETIAVSPELISEKQLVKEKQIKDGFKYALDANGNVITDSLGVKIKIDNFKTVQCRFDQVVQSKSAQVGGQVIFVDLKTKQQIDSYPISSEFVFEHRYASADGDKRALDNDLLPLLKLGSVPFPTNEEMVFDAGEDLKSRIKTILIRQRFL